MTPEQERKLNEAYNFSQNMKMSSAIPLPVDQAIRERFLRGTLGLTVSAKDPDSENQTVSEGGSATYNVLKEPDGYLQITVSNTIYYIPYFT